MSIKKITNKPTKPKTTHYTWKFWCIVTAFLAMVCIAILMFGISIKAVVQLVQMQSYDNSVRGTVTVAQYEGKTVADSETSHNAYKYEYFHYVIEFDETVAGYDKYEYSAHDMITVEKHIGDRYVILFNRIDKPVLIQEEDIVVDNVILIVFVVILIVALIFRKKLFELLLKTDGKLIKQML